MVMAMVMAMVIMKKINRNVFFFKKKYVPQRGPVLKVDLHSHFIPGIDDGAQIWKRVLH